MREIKFRAWDSFNECYYYSDEERFPSLAAFFIHVKFCEDGGNGILIEQYTGLKDKNGVEIYEGDILHEGDGTFWSRYEVVWFKNSCQFSLDCTRVSPNIQYPSWDRASGMTIIGNIHSNPELLK